MADIASTPDLLAEKPSENSNDNGGQNNSPGQGSIFEKFRAGASAVLEKHGVKFKPGRGRPRKDGSPKISDVPINATTTALPAGTTPLPPAASPVFDSALVRTCVSAVGKVVGGFLDRGLFRKSVRATGDADYSQKLVLDTTITEKELEALAELSEICLRKYGVGTEFVPEVGLASVIAGIGLRYSVAFKGITPKKEK